MEDDVIMAELLSYILEEEGYTVEVVHDPLTMGDCMSGEPPGLFIIDLLLPHMYGADLAHQLRASGCEGVPMIAMSASRGSLRDTQGRHIFEAVIGKPFDLALLLDTVRQLLG